MEQRYPVCECHPNDLVDVPNQNIELDYDRCARTCVFCKHEFKDASNLRRHAKICKLSTGIRVKSHKTGEFIRGHTWAQLPNKECASSFSRESVHKCNAEFFLEDLDGFDESIIALLKDIPLSTEEDMSEETRKEWSNSGTTWPRIFPAADFFDKDPPSTEALIGDILRPGTALGEIFCKGDKDSDIDPISVISQLHEPNSKAPLAIMGIPLPGDLIFTPPVSFSQIVEPFDVGNQQILLTTKYWETDAHLDHKDGFSAILGPGKKIWLTFPPSDNNMNQLKQAEGKKAKLRRIGKNLQHGLIHKTTSSDVIYLPSGCIHYVVTTHGCFIITIDFTSPESSKALSSLIRYGMDELDAQWRKQLFDNFLRSIELGLTNNQIPLALSSWVKIHDLIKEWVETNKLWKNRASKIWNTFFRSLLSKGIISCSCQNMFDGSFENHFRNNHMFSQLRSRTSSSVTLPCKRRRTDN